jgi:predicted dehydrogenase
MSKRTLRMGMIGGGMGAFIGPVHRMAARLDGGIDFVAGALASSPQKSIESGRAVGLADDRNYESWQAMLDAEAKRSGGDCLDFVTIVTPNATHFEIARACVDAGFNVVIDKPMVATPEEADELALLVKKRGVLCCVTYNYTGYPMVKQARALVQSGEIGVIRKVHVTYHQGWLAHPLERQGQKQATWRAHGNGGAIADIGSHAENLARYVACLEIDSLAAKLNTFVPERRVDDDANVLLRFQGGATGVLIASQICIGSENDLRISVHGTSGSLHWQHERHSELRLMLDGQAEVIHRAGNAYLDARAQSASRLPPGHPEGFIEAFANIYRSVASAIHAGSTDGPQHDFPDVTSGVRGVRFINAAIESSRQNGAWLPLP